MSTTVYTNSKHYHDIADAIRAKNGTSNTYTPEEMAPAILDLKVSGSTIINNQDIVINPTETAQVITADGKYTGIGQVVVNAIDSNYVGSNVPRRGLPDLEVLDKDDLVISGPAGYYPEGAAYRINKAKRSSSTIDIDTNLGRVTASFVQPSGYLQSEDTEENTLQLDTQVGTTIIPSGTTQIAVSKNKYTLGDIDVAPVPTETATIVENGTYSPTEGK